jgi:hypothetical protein
MHFRVHACTIEMPSIFACGADNAGHQRDGEHDLAGPSGVAHVEAPPVAGVFMLCLSILCTVKLQPWYQICVYSSGMHDLLGGQNEHLLARCVCLQESALEFCLAISCLCLQMNENDRHTCTCA